MALTTPSRPQVMGIINVNNESFFSGSRFVAAQEVADKIGEMATAGASIIDLGACSTRPGSIPVSMEQEWEYLQGVLEVIAGENLQGRIKFSIDTFRSEIVRRAYDIIGEFIVNDISAGEDDTQMLRLALHGIVVH